MDRPAVAVFIDNVRILPTGVWKNLQRMRLDIVPGCYVLWGSEDCSIGEAYPNRLARDDCILGNMTLAFTKKVLLMCADT